MLLTKECDYGIRTIRSLADGEKKTIGEICEQERIPVPYAYKISKKLERAGLIKSLRGRNGGYQLDKSLHLFTLFDIIVAIDERLFIFKCLDDGNPCQFHSEEDPCAVHLELERLQMLLVQEMQLKTMREVLQREPSSSP